ncbi:MAG TPA: HD domain-containing protein [Herpetosiphonaceae bacterium]|nr:HD domain-containing protein [Herpetosiphonaceae bacterium]
MELHATALRALAGQVAARDGAAWVIGGTLRDMVLGRAIHDIDLALDLPALEVARALADELGGSYVPLDEGHAVARVVLRDGTVLDLASLRAATLEEDLRARDFTANAIAAPLLPDGALGPLIDPLDGQADIRAGRLRLCGERAFIDDPLRMLRAARIAARLEWTLDPALDAALRSSAGLIAGVSAERVRDELLALLATRAAAPWLRYLDRAGLLLAIIPELAAARDANQPGKHFFQVWEHLLEAVCAAEWIVAELSGDNRPPPPAPPATPGDDFPPAFWSRPIAARRWPELRAELQWRERVLAHWDLGMSGGHGRPALWKLALLLHDIAKPATRVETPAGRVTFHGHQDVGADMARAIAGRLRLSRAEIDYVETVVRAHMRPGQLYSDETSARAAYRFFRDLGDAGVDTLLHGLADHMSARGPNLSPHHWAMHLAWTDAMLGFHWDEEREQQKRAPLVTGSALMRELAIAPGPLVGRLLEAIREAQAAGEIRTADEALALARRLHA